MRDALTFCAMPYCRALHESDASKIGGGLPCHLQSCAGVGHCPMDEAPEQVNPRVLAFVERHSSLKTVDAPSREDSTLQA